MELNKFNSKPSLEAGLWVRTTESDTTEVLSEQLQIGWQIHDMTKLTIYMASSSWIFKGIWIFVWSVNLPTTYYFLSLYSEKVWICMLEDVFSTEAHPFDVTMSHTSETIWKNNWPSAIPKYKYI